MEMSGELPVFSNWVLSWVSASLWVMSADEDVDLDLETLDDDDNSNNRDDVDSDSEVELDEKIWTSRLISTS